MKREDYSLEKAGLLAYSHGEYLTLGDSLGTFGWSVRKASVSRKNKKNAEKRSLYRKRIRRVQERKRYQENVRNNIEKYKVKARRQILAPFVY